MDKADDKLMDKDIWIGVLNAGKLYVKFNYDDNKIKKIRTINGKTWEPTEKYWTIPCTEEKTDRHYYLR